MNERINEALGKILGFFKRKPSADKASAASALAAVNFDPSRSPLLQAKRPVLNAAPPAEAQPAPAAEAVPGAAAAPDGAPEAAPEPAPTSYEVEMLRSKTADLETRLAAAQETILKLAEESAVRDEAQRQALARTEDALREFMAEQKAAQESDKTGDRLAALDAACLKLGAGAAETVSRAAEASSRTSEELVKLKEQLAALTARLDNVESKFPEMAATRDTAALLVERQGGLESRLSMAEARLSEVSVRGDLRDKLNARDFTTARERVENVEKDIAVLGGLERRVELVEMDSRRVMKLEAGAAAVSKRLEKMEADLRNMVKEQVYVSTEHKAGGVVIEELRAKFANMSVVFDYLRKEIDQFKHKV